MEPKLARNENLTIAELHEQNTKIKSENEQLYVDVKKIDKNLSGRLWLLWFIPIVGWVVYTIIFSKRKESQEYLNIIIPVKRQITMNELQIIYNNQLIEKQEKNQTK